MSSLFSGAGAATAQSEYAPLHTGRFTTGLWTNRSPLRDAAVTSLQERAGYGRQDSLIGGINTEISSRLTLIRRPGQSVYNGHTFPAINRFYGFRMFGTASESVRVMADTAAAVYDGTADGRVNIWRKSAGAGSTTFLGVGNTLYMGNGVDQTEWVQSNKSWSAGASFSYGDYLIDANGNLQAIAPVVSLPVNNINITSNVLTVGVSNIAVNPFTPGRSVTLSGLSGSAASLNGTVVTVITSGVFSLTAALVHANIDVPGATGTVSTAPPTTTGTTAPVWATAIGAITLDNGIQWINRGAAARSWGVAAPTTAPTLSTVALPFVYPAWAAGTIYSSSLLVVDSANFIQKLTKAGITGSSAPSWNETVGGTTMDGSAVWTNRGSATWTASATYAAGALVSVTFSYYVSDTGPNGQPIRTRVTVTDFFQATTGGASGTGTPQWVDGNGALVNDGQIVWQNLGASATWASLIGGSIGIVTAQTILDPNGNLQNIVTSGKSGSAQPSWSNIAGGSTTDGTAAWTNAGPYAAAAQSPQLYSYAFGRSVTGEVSNVSPLSAAITLPAESYVNVQGSISSDPNDDVVYLFRTAKGGSTQLYLATIPMPTIGTTWNYADQSTDAALVVEWQGAQAGQLTPPPAGAVVPVYHNGRIFVAVGNVTYWSAGPDATVFAANGNSGFSPANSMTWPSKVVRYWACPLGLIVFTVSDIQLITGSGTAASPYEPDMYLEGIGLRSYDAFTVNGSTAHILTTDLQIIALDPGAGLTEEGLPIADIIEASYGDASQLTFHKQGHRDVALYCGDGALGWYRLAASSAPESGSPWSPQAVIQGGVRALQSVEIAPGQKRLLMSGPAGGPILMRDATTNTDAGTPFLANAVAGSIMVALPGQIAELVFFTLDSTRVGTRPTMGVLLGEISGRFETLTRSRQDPPLLPPSRTLFNDRYYMAQNQQPVFCRHFQMAVNWPAEDAPAELHGYTIFGTTHNERASG